jgi:DNA anti-recombination protein RmuC
MARIKADLAKTDSLFVTTKTELFKQLSDGKNAMLSAQYEMKDFANELTLKLDDSKFLMSKYTDRFQESENFLAAYKVDLKSEMDNIRYEMSKRISNTDMELNMKALKDLLLLKFEQIEDMKEGLRDVMVF